MDLGGFWWILADAKKGVFLLSHSRGRWFEPSTTHHDSAGDAPRRPHLRGLGGSARLEKTSRFKAQDAAKKDFFGALRGCYVISGRLSLVSD